MKLSKVFAYILALNLVASFASASAFAEAKTGETKSVKCGGVNTTSGGDGGTTSGTSGSTGGTGGTTMTGK